jgi:ElaB/YqjD/DUF883 family membrane-anchored ribosome-binding protein
MILAFRSGGAMAKETPFDRARDFVEEKIDQTKDVLGDSYSQARVQFDDVSDEVRKNLKKTARRLEKDYGPVWEDVRRYVRDNPGTALAIALGAGFLFGMMVRGGDD